MDPNQEFMFLLAGLAGAIIVGVFSKAPLWKIAICVIASASIAAAVGFAGVSNSILILISWVLSFGIVGAMLGLLRRQIAGSVVGMLFATIAVVSFL